MVLSEDAVVEGTERTFSVENGGLQFPSGSSSGVKVRIEGALVVTSGLSTDLVLDFDLSRNFVLNGPPDRAPGVKRVLFTPVVRAVNASTSGTIALTVLSEAGGPAPDATVEVFDALADVPEGETPTPIATATAAPDGTVSISLPPGLYDLVVSATGHDPATLPGVPVTAANTTSRSVWVRPNLTTSVTPP